MANFRFARLFRTPSSEVIAVWDGDRRIGQVDLHFSWSEMRANVILEVEMREQEQDDLYAQIEADLASSHLPTYSREDFLVTVFRGEEIDSFSYPPQEEEGELEE